MLSIARFFNIKNLLHVSKLWKTKMYSSHWQFVTYG